jgi:hypothetical protein
MTGKAAGLVDQEERLMFNVELSVSGHGGNAVVALCGALDSLKPRLSHQA